MKRHVTKLITAGIAIFFLTILGQSQDRRKFDTGETDPVKTQSTPSQANAQIPVVGAGQSTPSQITGPESMRASRVLRIGLQIGAAAIQIICSETNNCPSNIPGGGNAAGLPVSQPANTRTEPATSVPIYTYSPNVSPIARSLGPALGSSTHAATGFAFGVPTGWNAYYGGNTITIAPKSEYVSGNLRNGVILGTLSAKTAGWNPTAMLQVIIGTNTYLRTDGNTYSASVGPIPCSKFKLSGLSPKSGALEKVEVTMCRGSNENVNYAIGVTSGPNGEMFKQTNAELIRTIRF